METDRCGDLESTSNIIELIVVDNNIIFGVRQSIIGDNESSDQLVGFDAHDIKAGLNGRSPNGRIKLRIMTGWEGETGDLSTYVGQFIRREISSNLRRHRRWREPLS